MYRTIVLTFHIVAVAAWLGANLVLLAASPRMEARGELVAALWNETLASLSRTYYNAAGVTVAVSGGLLVLDGPYGWGSSFVGLGFVTVIVGAVVGATIIAPTADKAAHAHRGATAEDPDARQAVDLTVAGRLRNRLTTAVVVDTALVVVTVVAMVHKWGAS